jgi:hypothetical protein
MSPCPTTYPILLAVWVWRAWLVDEVCDYSQLSVGLCDMTCSGWHCHARRQRHERGRRGHITFWHDGLSVEDDGPLRHENAQNEHMLAEIHEGCVPAPLFPVRC